MPHHSSDRLSSGRMENSLFSLTKKFFLFLKQTYPRPVNTNSLASYLCVSKRRVYDVTNILEGLGYLKKKSVNSLEWIGGDFNQFISDDENSSEQAESTERQKTQKNKENYDSEEQNYRKEDKLIVTQENKVSSINTDAHTSLIVSEGVGDSQEEYYLSITENRLDQEIDLINTSVQKMLQNEISITNAFVNKNDLLNLSSLREKLVFVVKAPSDTFLENKDSPGEYAIEMNVNNDNIDVYFISDEEKRNL